MPLAADVEIASTSVSSGFLTRSCAGLLPNKNVGQIPQNTSHEVDMLNEQKLADRQKIDDPIRFANKLTHPAALKLWISWASDLDGCLP
jgi:hypothetical protein